MLTKRADLLTRAGDLASARTATSRALALQREIAIAPGAPPDVLNDYAWHLVSCQPPDLRQPALPEAGRQLAVETLQSDLVSRVQQQ